MKRLLRLGTSLLLIASGTSPAAETYQYRVAFMPDIHFHDVYGEFADQAFSGLKNSKSGKPAIIRTMYAQLTSTRLFNENYFALRAALDDAGKRGIKWVALPGDFSDDGQPYHVRGLVKLLHEYEQKYGMRFFATPGNHDPNRPFTTPGGEEDFLGEEGRTQRIFSRGAKECQGYQGATARIKTDAELPTICSEEMVSGGYQAIMTAMGDFGINPSPDDLYWETPYSRYGVENYRYQAAQQASDFSQRQYEICAQGTGGIYKKPGYGPCFTVADSSYLVEPVPGLWLLAVDANVYLPAADARTDKPRFSGSGEAGYNSMLTHKQQTVAWMADVAQRARKLNKTLVTFSHFPMVEFDNGAAADLADIFGEGKFQLARAPREDTSHALAKTGIGVHVGGHMHFNDTGVRRYADGSLLFNIQAPSLAAYVPAYKILNFTSPTEIDVETVIVKEVPRFNELFEHYQQEWDHLNATHSPHLWNRAILQADSYYAFTNWHITELARLRFLPEEWPEDLRKMLFTLIGEEMLIISQLNQGEYDGKKSGAAWEAARQKAQALAQRAGMNHQDFARWNGFELAVDFYRLRNADELALADIPADRLRQYQLLTGALASRLTPASLPLSPHSTFEDMFRLRFGSIFAVINTYLHGNPARNFHINLESGKMGVVK